MPRHFGILIPGTNTTCEIEFCRLAPDLQMHSARLGKDGDTPFSPGLDVVAAEGVGAADSYAIGKMDAGMAQAAFARIDSPAVEALVVPGGNFPTQEWITPWETQFRKPVITTNAAALWGLLRAMKID